jgi:hypothetical protein
MGAVSQDELKVENAQSVAGRNQQQSVQMLASYI